MAADVTEYLDHNKHNAETKCTKWTRMQESETGFWDLIGIIAMLVGRDGAWALNGTIRLKCSALFMDTDPGSTTVGLIIYWWARKRSRNHWVVVCWELASGMRAAAQPSPVTLDGMSSWLMEGEANEEDRGREGRMHFYVAKKKHRLRMGFPICIQSKATKTYLWQASRIIKMLKVLWPW